MILSNSGVYTDYQQIDKLFGTPLNLVPKPKVPYEFKLWHGVATVIVLYLLYQGAVSVSYKIKERYEEYCER
jgi:hypothetical protein